MAIAYLSEEFCEKNLKLGVLKKICVLIAGKQAFFYIILYSSRQRHTSSPRGGGLIQQKVKKVNM